MEVIYARIPARSISTAIAVRINPIKRSNAVIARVQARAAYDRRQAERSAIPRPPVIERQRAALSPWRCLTKTAAPSPAQTGPLGRDRKRHNEWFARWLTGKSARELWADGDRRLFFGQGRQGGAAEFPRLSGPAHESGACGGNGGDQKRGTAGGVGELGGSQRGFHVDGKTPAQLAVAPSQSG